MMWTYFVSKYQWQLQSKDCVIYQQVLRYIDCMDPNCLKEDQFTLESSAFPEITDLDSANYLLLSLNTLQGTRGGALLPMPWRSPNCPLE